MVSQDPRTLHLAPASQVEEHIHDEDFAHWYATSGRPSIPASFMMTLMLLQIRQGWSDPEAVEAVLFDDAPSTPLDSAAVRRSRATVR